MSAGSEVSLPFCPECGTAVAPGTKFCSNCGTPLAQTPRAIPVAQPPVLPIPAGPKKPLPLLALALSDLAAGALVFFIGAETLAFVPPREAAAVAGPLGLVLLALGVASFAVGYAFTKLRGWAWAPGIGVGLCYLVLGLLTFSTSYLAGVLCLILGGAAAFYLSRPGVRILFGRPQKQ